MLGKRFSIAVLAMATWLVAPAAAQEQLQQLNEQKNEVAAVIGRTLVSDQGIAGATYFDPIIHHGAGLSLEGEYARRFLITPIFSISGEVPVMFNFKEKLNAGMYGFSVVPAYYRAIFVTPAARINLFPTTAVSPWISFGGGFAHFSESNVLIYGGSNPGQSTTNAVIQGGAGLDVRVWRRLHVRGEVRDFWSGEPDFPLAPTGKSRQHNYFVGGGAMWRF